MGVVLMPKIFGKVYDAETGRVIPFFAILVETPEGRLVAQTLTNFMGRYEIEVPRGTYVIKFRSVFYEPVAVKRKIETDTEINVRVRPIHL